MKNKIDGMRFCNICTGEFDLIEEGGMDGYIGVLRFALCPTCYAGIVDMVKQCDGEHWSEVVND
tara:strand:- start:936 stop:1127 length:192 start_codon:yes stop_codon:yes gene_type:complete